ncbi:MAG: Trk family potassium uptake protein [Deltaproteobacteria bacterium GWC2_42_11]|nr:MAG: Trk family potassium uptake protein [Deltaproteobacteria bacterium GWC2_42_11]HBO84490.1 Trk family potassium uptake protein [Deltaproteobacteria bacterium]
MKFNLSPSQIIALGFLGIILFGTVILLLPVSSAAKSGISIVDAIFTSTSAVCVTGLVVLDTPNDLSLFGQAAVLFLIQLGGLGYMTSATILSIVVGKKVGLKERLVLQEALNVLSVEGLIRFTKGVLKVTILFESIGAVILSIRFAADMEPGRAVYFGIFHAVSAFNNAGFSLFSNNLIDYRGDIVVNIVITTLIITGGIGFLVISDIYKYMQRSVLRVSTHTKMAILFTVVLIVSGTIFILSFEYFNPNTLYPESMKTKLLTAYFQSVTSRTAGFNTLDISMMQSSTLLLFIMLMFIGASPGGTGGGIKTTTFGIMMVALWSSVRGNTDVVVFERRLSHEAVARAYLIAAMGVIVITVATLLLLVEEKANYLHTLFEAASAFGTVGLSVGDSGVRSLSALFSDMGKLTIAFTMYIGRIGPLTMGMAVVKRAGAVNVRYPEGKVLIG